MDAKSTMDSRNTTRTLASARRPDSLDSLEHIFNGPILNGATMYWKGYHRSLLNYVNRPPYEDEHPIVLLEWDIDQLRVFIEKLEASRSSNLQPPPSMAEFFSPDADEFRLVDCLLDHICCRHSYKKDLRFWRLERAGFEVGGRRGAMKLALALARVEHDPWFAQVLASGPPLRAPLAAVLIKHPHHWVYVPIESTLWE